MKEIITEINKRSEYLKPDKKFTKNLRNQVLAHSKTTQKAKSNFWAIIWFSQAIAMTLIVAFFINLTPLNVKDVLAKAEEVNKKQAQNGILHTVINEKYYPDWKNLESEITNTSYVYNNKHLLEKELNWNKIIHLNNWFLSFTNEELDANLFLTKYEENNYHKEFRASIDEEIKLITRKSFKNKTNLIKEIAILRTLTKKYKKNPSVELMNHIKSEIKRLSIKSWMTKIEYEAYLKKSKEKNSFSIISLWKKWWITHDELFNFIGENVNSNYTVNEKWNSIIVEVDLWNTYFDRVTFWKNDYKITKTESFRKRWNYISDLVVQEYKTVEYISPTNENTIFNMNKNELKVLKK